MVVPFFLRRKKRKMRKASPGDFFVFLTTSHGKLMIHRLIDAHIETKNDKTVVTGKVID